MVFLMPAGQSIRPNDALARKWCELAQRRRAHFLELYDSGRWKHYYDEEQFLARLREAVAAAETWAKLAAARPDAGQASPLPADS